MKPPLTRPKITPVTRSSFSDAFSSSIQASSRRAFSRDNTDSPSRFSMRSTKTSTTSPVLISASSPGRENSCKGMRPSDFRPTSTIAKSSVTAIMVPFTTEPVKFSCPLRDSSRRAANSFESVLSWIFAATLAIFKFPSIRVRVFLCFPPFLLSFV